MTQTFRIDQLVDDQKLGWFNGGLFFWSFLAMFADGYDLAALSYAQPELQTLWHVPKSAFGPVSSASLVGILFGAPLFGFVGDRLGRRSALVASCAMYGLFTLGIAWTDTLSQIAALRFLAGLGLGGVMPNTIALNSELAPRRLRATLITLMFIGITIGSASQGIVAYSLMPRFGWTVLFIIGGIGSLTITAGLALRLPESVKFLSLRPSRRLELLATLRRMRPDISLSDDVQFTADPAGGDSGAATKFREIFKGTLGRVTALLWVCFAMALMVNFFLNSFLPLIFAGVTDKRQAALLAALFPIGGTIGGLLISALVDHYGMVVIVGFFALAVPAIIGLGFVHPALATLAPLCMLAGLAVQGAQFGNNAAAGLLYPTGVRAKGVGLALGIGRVGAIAALLLGSRFIGIPLRHLFLATATPMLMGACAASLLLWLCYKRSGRWALREVTPDGIGHPADSALVPD